VAKKVGKDRASVANYIRLLKLPSEIQKKVSEGKLSMGHARALITLENPDQQIFISRIIIEKNLSVRDVEKLMAKKRSAASSTQGRAPDPDLLALQEEFIKILGTKVSISGNSEKGVIRLYYFSLEELNGIYEKIKGEGV